MITQHAPQSSGPAKDTGRCEPLAAMPRSGIRTVALPGEGYTPPTPLLSSAVKDFLDGFLFGRFGLGVGRKIFKFVRNSQDPIQRKLWIGRFSLPLRNTMLLNRPLLVSFNGISVFLEPHGEEAGDIWAGLRRERRDVSFLLNVLEPGMIFFDVGTNAGLLAISAAKKIGGNGVFAFETSYSTCDLLRRNLLLNHLADVNVAQMALGDKVGERVSQIDPRGENGPNASGQVIRPIVKVAGREDVRITTLDVFMTAHNIPRIDVLKVDQHGAELMLFRGARDLLVRPDAPLILYEGSGFLTREFGYHPVEILWFLESCGYSFFSLNGETGETSELKPDYKYDSMVIAAKPGHAAFENLRARLQ